jgi:hypothetical protein
MSSCVPSSAAVPPGWGFAELDALRVEHDLAVSRFCRIVGLPARTYYDRRARHDGLARCQEVYAPVTRIVESVSAAALLPARRRVRARTLR